MIVPFGPAMLISLSLITRESSDYSMSTQQKTMSSLLNNYRSCSHSYYIGGPINTGITTTYNPHLTMGLLCNSKMQDWALVMAVSYTLRRASRVTNQKQQELFWGATTFNGQNSHRLLHCSLIRDRVRHKKRGLKALELINNQYIFCLNWGVHKKIK